MTTSGQTSSSGPPAGGGRLAQMIATRGGRAAPEAPFVIEHREALIYMLCEAAELEHGIMCQYLFAAFSLKQSAAEGLTGAEVDAVIRWRKQVAHVATQEMLHLALVQNLLSAIGAAPHMSRPNLPLPAEHYPAGVQLALLPFGEQALRHFMFLERPEGMDLADADGLAAIGRAQPLLVEPKLSDRDIVPRPQDFATVGHLYRSIEAGFAHLADKYGADWLFVGPPRAQATEADFRWPELVAVTDLATAQRAIDTILEQGEGPRGNWRNAHFGQFVAILDEYEQLRAANPHFDPVRPVMAANVRQPERDIEVPLITDPLTARVTDLFNVGYEILLQIFERYFAHTEETDAQLAILADATVALMFRVIKPLGDLITTLPVGPDHPGKTAGPSFELFYETDYLMPHREAAWALLAERLDEAVWLCTELQGGRGIQIASQLEPVTAAMKELSRTLAGQLPARNPHARLAAPAAEPAPAELESLLARADDLARRADTATHDDAISRALAGEPRTDAVWAAAKTATELRTRLDGAAALPELTEAVAVLQDLACRLAPPQEAAGRLAELGRLQAGLPTVIQTARNGPYLVTNVSRLRNYLGEPVETRPTMALCRCGGSAIKPLCDGTHARTGFSDEKDPKRVPDRRDTYQGQQVTVFDNRGTCQHAGFCTDRLATVFRQGAEPFVTPSGARMDEIMRAVRDCPSGALSFAIGGREAREYVDWDGPREPAIEITKDGPYRVTGRIGLTDPDGTEIARNEGASREHYALCRCGHSQNKPFCSGMHWYVDFRDPPPPARDPTLFEWAGGLPALTRMTRLLYEKLVPADPLLAPLFATMPPGHPERVARHLGAVFGGPDSESRTSDGGPPRTDAFGGKDLTEEQRARWVSLTGQAAQAAGLPTDPAFLSAFTGYIAWESATPLQDSEASAEASAPRWDWGPAGPPRARVPATPAKEEEKPVSLPGPGQPVSFAAHIKPLFRERDKQSMSFAFDLWSYDDVKAHAPDILTRLASGSMPCDGAWPDEQVQVFRRWTGTGTQP